MKNVKEVFDECVKNLESEVANRRTKFQRFIFGSFKLSAREKMIANICFMNGYQEGQQCAIDILKGEVKK